MAVNPPPCSYRKVNCETFFNEDWKPDEELRSPAGISGNASDEMILEFVREFLAERARDRNHRKLVLEFAPDSAH